MRSEKVQDKKGKAIVRKGSKVQKIQFYPANRVRFYLLSTVSYVRMHSRFLPVYRTGVSISSSLRLLTISGIPMHRILMMIRMNGIVISKNSLLSGVSVSGCSRLVADWQ